MENTIASSKRYFGQVKWFNTKAGYGFITVCKDGSHIEEKDIFVHYSALRVGNPQYKYLVQGEYVEFSIVKPENDKYEYHAIDISGILGGNIMCETKRLSMPPAAPSSVGAGGQPTRFSAGAVSAVAVAADAPTTEDGFKKVMTKKQRNLTTAGTAAPTHK